TLFFFFGFCLQVVFVHLVPHATDVGFSVAEAASLLSVIGGTSIIGRIGLGTIGDKIGTRKTILVIFIMLTVSFWLLLVNDLSLFYVLAVVFAIGYGAMSAIQSPIVLEFFGVTAHGAIFGLAMVGYSIGGAIGPVVAGRLFDTSGSYLLVFLICFAFSIASIVMASQLRPIRKLH
ncbi:MAG: MFS transporter, partial [Syntrophales bacterium]|nr:MFS transporter [Syntrophales bacterium]